MVFQGVNVIWNRVRLFVTGHSNARLLLELDEIEYTSENTTAVRPRYDMT